MPVAVDKSAFVRLDTNRYSVPPTFARRSLTLVASDTTLRLLDGAQEVARHERSWGRNQTVENREHRAPILEEKKKARDLKGRDRLRVEIPDIEVMLTRWVDAGRNLGSMIGFTIKLLDAYGADTLRLVVANMLARGTHDKGAMAILCEQHRRRNDSPAPLALNLAKHVVERDVVPHDLGGYDD
jgi:hypothetical protein